MEDGMADYADANPPYDINISRFQTAQFVLAAFAPEV
jgi:hypothetical protein